MSFGLDDIASTFCKDDCKDGKKNNNIFVLILIILVFFCCACGSPTGGFIYNPCIKPARGGRAGGAWVIILVILLALGGGGTLAGPSGNLNTNIINLERDYYDDDDYI